MLVALRKDYPVAKRSPGLPLVMTAATHDRLPLVTGNVSFYFGGQSCMTAGRHLIHSSLIDEYIQRFVEAARSLIVAKFDSIAEIDPESLRLAEQQRAHAFYSDVFDVKTTQLILFGMLLHAGVPAAKFHALAARRAGASREELQKVTELAAAALASGPMNTGGSILKDLRADEVKG